MTKRLGANHDNSDGVIWPLTLYIILCAWVADDALLWTVDRLSGIHDDNGETWPTTGTQHDFGTGCR
jgi:hypothetical protein